MYDAANRLEQVSHQSTVISYQFDDNGNLLQTGALTNTFDAANRLTAVSRQPSAVSFVYNGVNDRVAQVTNGVTTTFALDAQGLPEVIYTSDDEAYLHLPGVIVTEKNGEVRYLRVMGWDRYGRRWMRRARWWLIMSSIRMAISPSNLPNYRHEARHWS